MIKKRWNEVDHGLNDERTPPDFRCIECGKQPRLTDGREIYPHRPDLHSKRFYKCDNCNGSYCGCHPDTTTPLGYPCGPETRKARSAAHEKIDPIWREKITSRNKVYAMLADKMGIRRNDCHIAWMTASEARKAASLAQEIRNDLKN